MADHGPRSGLSQSFERTAGVAAFAAAALSLVYAVAFVIIKNDFLAALALLVGSLLSAVVLFAVYDRVRVAGSLARAGLALGVAGTLGAAVHGAYDLANVLHPPDVALSGPNPVDPRGFLTFGVAGLGVLLLAWAALSTAGLPRPLALFGAFFGVVLVVIYLGRLIVLDPANPLVLGPAALGGIIVGPIWYAWLGYTLMKDAGRTGV
jgi:hypothetical protein